MFAHLYNNLLCFVLSICHSDTWQCWQLLRSKIRRWGIHLNFCSFYFCRKVYCFKGLNQKVFSLVCNGIRAAIQILQTSLLLFLKRLRVFHLDYYFVISSFEGWMALFFLDLLIFLADNFFFINCGLFELSKRLYIVFYGARKFIFQRQDGVRRAQRFLFNTFENFNGLSTSRVVLWFHFYCFLLRQFRSQGTLGKRVLFLQALSRTAYAFGNRQDLH